MHPKLEHKFHKGPISWTTEGLWQGLQKSQIQTCTFSQGQRSLNLIGTLHTRNGYPIMRLKGLSFSCILWWLNNTETVYTHTKMETPKTLDIYNMEGANKLLCIQNCYIFLFWEENQKILELSASLRLMTHTELVFCSPFHPNTLRQTWTIYYLFQTQWSRTTGNITSYISHITVFYGKGKASVHNNTHSKTRQLATICEFQTQLHKIKTLENCSETEHSLRPLVTKSISTKLGKLIEELILFRTLTNDSEWLHTPCHWVKYWYSTKSLAEATGNSHIHQNGAVWFLLSLKLYTYLF